MEAPLPDTTVRGGFLGDDSDCSALSLHGPSDRPGLLFLGSAAAYGIGRLGLEPLRAEAVGTPLAVRINMAFSAMLAVVALACFVALAARGV
jgi:prolipoprotein diacylglyceryltransferase